MTLSLLYFFFSITGALVPSGVSLLSDDEDDTPSVVSSIDGLSETSVCFQSQEINGKEFDVKVGSEIPLKNEPMLPADESSLWETITGKVITPINSQTIKTNEQQKFPVVGLTQDTVHQESLLSGQQGTELGQSSMKTSYVEGAGHVVRDTCKSGILRLHECGSSPDSFSGKFFTGVSSPSIPLTLPKGVDLGKEIPGKLGSDSSEGASSNRKLTSQVTSDRGSSHLSSGSILSNQSGNSASSLSISHLTGGSFGASSYAKEDVGSLNTFCCSVNTAYSGGQSTSTGAGTRELLPAIRSSPFSSQQNLTFGKSSKDKFHHSKENYRSPSPTRPLNSEPYLSKQFGNVIYCLAFWILLQHILSIITICFCILVYFSHGFTSFIFIGLFETLFFYNLVLLFMLVPKVLKTFSVLTPVKLGDLANPKNSDAKETEG